MLLYFAVSAIVLHHWPPYALIALLLIAHNYREYEYFTDNSQKFCGNLPLFIMNDVKLTHLFIT